MGDTVYLQGMKALKIQNWHRVFITGRITLVISEQITTHLYANTPIIFKSLGKDLTNGQF